MWGRTFSEEDDDTDDGDETSATDDVEYTFEGFNIEFSEKVALMPAAASVSKPRTDGAYRDG
jgi:hypothetical protein